MAVWIVCAVTAFAVARIVPAGRSSRWMIELLTSLLVAFLLGVAATALDFGGWREPDWRAGLFALFGALAALGTLRAIRSPSSQSRRGQPPPRA
jgi:predicted MFS family arabinose efflux permease